MKRASSEPDEIELRQTRIGDAERIARLRSERSGRPYPRLMLETERELASIDGRRLMLHVATIDGAFAGFGRCRYVDAADTDIAQGVPAGWYLAGVIVAPAYRGRGVGGALTRHRLNWVAHRAKQVYYFADDDNLASIRLHEGLGFAVAKADFQFRKDRPSPVPMTLFVREL